MSRTGRLVIVGVVVLVLALGGGFLLFVNRTSDSPPPAALDPAPTTTAGEAAAEGEQVQGEGTGRLTVHGVTREVDLSVQGRWNGSTIQVVGQLPVKMSDFQIEPPRFGPVVSIEDSLNVDFNLVFERA